MRYSRPAVYLERTDASASDQLSLRTDIAGFVGIARRGPLDTPIPVESFRQYLSHFGDFNGAGYLPYAVGGFFENGGKRCWVARVANRDEVGGARPAATMVPGLSGSPALRIEASSPGSWGNTLSLEWMQESGVRVVSNPAESTERHAGVTSTAGFGRFDLVRIEQPGRPVLHRVVAGIDAERRRLYWLHPEPGAGLPTDRALTGLDPGSPLLIERLAYGLTVREAGRVAAVYRDLQLTPGHPRWIGAVLAAQDLRPDWLPGLPVVRGSGLPRAPEPVVVETLLAGLGTIPEPLAFDVGVPLALSGGMDGLDLLSETDFIGEPATPGDSDVVRRRKTRGLESLAGCEEITLLAMPDIHLLPDPVPPYEPVPPPVAHPCRPCPPPPPARTVHQPLLAGERPPGFTADGIARLQAALLDHCERLGDRFAVLSVPLSLAADQARSREELDAWRDRFDSRHGALYLPWLEVVDPRDTARTLRIPGCGHITGAIARTDLSSGVHRAPGNLPLAGVSDLSRTFDDDVHGNLNLAGLNVLRGEFGRPPLLAGARTLSHDPDWSFINVARLVLALKKAIDLTLRWIVFEPNNHATRAAVTASLTSLLQDFFVRGAFRGATSDESYFVRCDEATTPPQEREAGRLIALVGIAPAVPCEFIVLRVGREHNTLTVTLFEPEGLHS